MCMFLQADAARKIIKKSIVPLAQIVQIMYRDRLYVHTVAVLTVLSMFVYRNT